MNPLAQELNDVLQGTAALSLLSDFGKRFYFPKGIITQTAEAKKFASKFNATVGMAFDQKEPICLKTSKENMPGLSPKESVAYAPTPGDATLRDLWKEEILRKNPEVHGAGISQPMVVTGLTNGIAHLADLFVDPDDVVIIPDMFWGNYRLTFEARKCAKIVAFPFFNGQGGLNIRGFKETIMNSARNGKAVLMVNFPNNPTGYSPTKKEVEELSRAILECAESGIKILAITDDAYFGLFYEKNTYTHSIFSVLSSIHENVLAVKVDGATKEDYMWGFRIGFVTFGGKTMTSDQYEALGKKLMGAIRSSISNSSRPAQSLLIKALQDPGYIREKEQYFQILKERYQKVRNIVDSRKESPALTALPFNSGYFMSFQLNGLSAEKLRTELLHKKGIGTISIQDKFLRVAYASVDLADLEELYSKIYETAERLL